jgi:hypothetical protein
MIPRLNITSDFVDKLAFMRKSVENVARSKKKSCVGYSTLLLDKSILREVSAGHWGTERGTS